MAGFESQDFLSQDQMERLRISDDAAGVDDSIFNLYAENIANDEGKGRFPVILTISTCCDIHTM